MAPPTIPPAAWRWPRLRTLAALAAVSLSPLACGPLEESEAWQEPVATVQQGLLAEGQSAKPYNCNELDYGLYWYAKDNASQKAWADGREMPGYYSRSKPTIIYIHGAQPSVVKNGRRLDFPHLSDGREEFLWDKGNVNVANDWLAKGWNVGIFHWTQLADDVVWLEGGEYEGTGGAPMRAEAKIHTTSGTLVGPVNLNMRWRKCDGTFSTTGMPTVPVGVLAYQAIKSALSQYTGTDFRMVGHSLGNQLATVVTDKLYADTTVPANRRPSRVALVDPYWSLYAKGYLNNQWTGEYLRYRISDLKGKGVVFEWTKTSGVTDLYGDKNDPLLSIISKTVYFPDFLPNTAAAVGERHSAAPKLYFWSNAFVEPDECFEESTTSCLPTGRRSHSARLHLNAARNIMLARGLWEQVTGKTTATPQDDKFRCVDRCPGMVSVWGTNQYGQLGLGNTTTYATPTRIPSLSGTRYIETGLYFSLTVNRQDASGAGGDFFNFGSNGWGQLADNTTTQRLSPVQVLSADTVALAAGTGHALRLMKDGTVWAWGGNGNGQLGLGDFSSRSTMTRVTSLSGVKAVAAGGLFSLALKADGTVWAWGQGSSGQLGNNTMQDSTLPVQVVGLSGVMAIAAGSSHSLALKTDGTVWAWGDNWVGQLGDGTGGASGAKRLTPVQVKTAGGVALTGVAAISAGSRHNLALKDGGIVWAWGGNPYGQVGDGTMGTARLTAVQAKNWDGSFLTGVSAISAGWLHNLALMKADGSVRSWGYNGDSQLGYATSTQAQPTAKKVGDLLGVAKVEAGDYHSMVLHWVQP